MKKIAVLIMSLLSISAFSYCPILFESENLCADLEWTRGPVLNQTSGFEVTFWENGDPSHTPVSPGFEVEFMTWMVMDNGHSHGGPAINWDEVEPGVFIVNDARFFMHGMKGYWQVKIQLTENAELVEEQAVMVPLK